MRAGHVGQPLGPRGGRLLAPLAPREPAVNAQERQKARDKHAALLQMAGRTPQEIASFRAIADRFRAQHLEAFLPEISPPFRPFSSPPRPAAPPPDRAVELRPAGHLSAPLVLGEDVFTAHRWVLAVGLANELGCVVTTDGKETYFFATAKDPVKRASETLMLYTLSTELDATRALGKIPPGSDDLSVKYYRQVWMRGASNAILAERIRMTTKKRLSEARDRSERARQAVAKVPGWKVIDQAPNDPWAPKS